MKKGWEIKAVGDVCKSASSNVSQNSLDTNIGEYPIYGASGLIKKVNFYHRDKPYLSIVKDGSGFGRITIMSAYTSVIGTLQYIIPNEEIDLNYLYYNLLSIDFKKYVSGAAIPHIYFKDYKTEPFLWIPIKEQKELVAIIDDAFESIESAKSNAEQNLKNAKELFESYLNDIFESKDKEWVIEPFEKVCNLVGGSQPSKDDFIYEPRNGYIRLIQVRDYRTSKFITYIPKEKARRFCSENDIMIGRYGPPIFGIFKGLEGAYNVALMKAEVNNKLCDSEYFYWFLKTNKLRQFVEKSSKRAAGQDGIRKELLDKYPVPFPKSIEKQKSIVRNIELLINETKRLESIYQQKLNDLEDLKKSILQKAFNGELKTSKISA